MMSSFLISSIKVVNGDVYVALVQGSSCTVSRLRGSSIGSEMFLSEMLLRDELTFKFKV